MQISSRKIISKRHHYLPVFYLNGFCDSEGLFFVFDKKQDDFLPRCTPYSKFYSNHLNNYRFNGKPIFSYEEKYFSPMDSKGARILKQLMEFDLNGKDNFPPELMIDLAWFLTNLYWRSPNSNAIFKEIIKKEGLNNSNFGFYNKEKGIKLNDKDIPEIKSQILNDDELQKLFRFIMPHINSNYDEMWKLLQNYCVYDVPNASLISGDSPILVKPHELKLNNIFEEIIFPISKKRVIIFGKRTPKFFDFGLLKSYINLGILNFSSRYICSDCQSKIIETLKHRDVLAKQGQYDEVLKNLFKIKDIQSNFEDFEKYVEYYNYLKNK